MNAAYIAHFDQLHAASRDALGLLELVAQREPKLDRYDVAPSAFVRSLVLRFVGRGVDGRLIRCPHLSRTGPGMCWLFGWEPDRLRCQSCAMDEHRRLQGTPEVDTCDVCRVRVPSIRSITVAIGPVLLCYGACEGCWPAERAGAR